MIIDNGKGWKTNWVVQKSHPNALSWRYGRIVEVKPKNATLERLKTYTDAQISTVVLLATEETIIRARRKGATLKDAAYEGVLK